MRREIEAIPSAEAALAFALGCLWTGLRERLPLAIMVRLGLAGMSGALTVMVGGIEVKNLTLMPQHGTALSPALLLALTVLGAGYALGAILAAKGAFRVFSRMACVMQFLAGVVFVATLSSIGDDGFFHALSIETFGIWSLFMALALMGQASRRSPS